jgi:hypothetical protein
VLFRDKTHCLISDLWQISARSNGQYFLYYSREKAHTSWKWLCSSSPKISRRHPMLCPLANTRQWAVRLYLVTEQFERNRVQSEVLDQWNHR